MRRRSADDKAHGRLAKRGSSTFSQSKMGYAANAYTNRFLREREKSMWQFAEAHFYAQIRLRRQSWKVRDLSEGASSQFGALYHAPPYLS